MSGKNKLPMVDLCNLLNYLKFKNVQTYFQSGNIILATDKSKKVVCQKIKEGINTKFGYEVHAIARTVSE